MRNIGEKEGEYLNELLNNDELVKKVVQGFAERNALKDTDRKDLSSYGGFDS